MDSLQCQVNSCTNGSHTGAPALLTELQPRQPSVTAVSSQSAKVSDPLHVPILTGECVGSISNQSTSRRQSRVSRSPSCSNNSRAIQPANAIQTPQRLQYRPSQPQKLPHPPPSLLLRSDERRCCRRPRKKQLDMQTLHNDSATTLAGTIADQQVRLRTSQPCQPVSPTHPQMEYRPNASLSQLLRHLPRLPLLTPWRRAAQPWCTPELREAIKMRNTLR